MKNNGYSNGAARRGQPLIEVSILTLEAGDLILWGDEKWQVLRVIPGALDGVVFTAYPLRHGVTAQATVWCYSHQKMMKVMLP